MRQYFALQDATERTLPCQATSEERQNSEGYSEMAPLGNRSLGRQPASQMLPPRPQSGNSPLPMSQPGNSKTQFGGMMRNEISDRYVAHADFVVMHARCSRDLTRL